MAQPIALVNPAIFWRNVDSSPGPTECWPWKGPTDRHGYGEYSRRLGDKRVRWGSHRVAYEMTVGPIPTHLVIDHLCRNRLCCNPAHMEPVTGAENTRRGQSGAVNGARIRSKDACPNGHPYVDGSYRLRRGRWRCCIECDSARKRRHRTTS